MRQGLVFCTTFVSHWVHRGRDKEGHDSGLGGPSSREGDCLGKKKREREREKERVMGCQQTLTAAQVWVHMSDEGHLSRVSRVSHVGIDSCT